MAKYCSSELNIVIPR